MRSKGDTAPCSRLAAKYNMITAQSNMLSAHCNTLTAHCNMITAHCSVLMYTQRLTAPPRAPPLWTHPGLDDAKITSQLGLFTLYCA